MPHYKDGTPAKVGDVVRGKGYNVKGPDGQLKEITGIVVHVQPGPTCNLQVAFAEVSELPEGFTWPDGNLFRSHDGLRIVSKEDGRYSVVRQQVEYGETAHFEKIG